MFAFRALFVYLEGMGDRNSVDYCETDSILHEEDEATLAAIDEGLRAADEGRFVPEEEVRKLLPRWISEFSTPSRR